MILSNIQMQEAMDSGRLVINPKPQPLRPGLEVKCPYDTHSVHLTLGHEVSIPRGGPYSFDLEQGGDRSEFLSRNSEKHIVTESGYALKSFQFVLGRTREYVSLPLDHAITRERGTCLAARIEGRSSVARCGVLVHFTAPTVHPGFEGTLTLEIINLGPTNSVVRPGMPIAQLIVEEASGIPFENPSVFQGQRTPEGEH